MTETILNIHLEEADNGYVAVMQSEGETEVKVANKEDASSFIGNYILETVKYLSDENLNSASEIQITVKSVESKLW